MNAIGYDVQGGCDRLGRFGSRTSLGEKLRQLRCATSRPKRMTFAERFDVRDEADRWLPFMHFAIKTERRATSMNRPSVAGLIILLFPIPTLCIGSIPEPALSE